MICYECKEEAREYVVCCLSCATKIDEDLVDITARVKELKAVAEAAVACFHRPHKRWILEKALRAAGYLEGNKGGKE